MTHENQFIPDKNTRINLARKLNLEFNELMQDWEYEIADADRILEFINEYDKNGTTEKEKETLMEIILDSANDLLMEQRQDEFEKSFDLIIDRLKKNKNIHLATLNYWKKNDFKISNRLKK